jgi:hypothetical protein
MVCVAAFIILCLIGIIVAFLSIFKREIGKKYLAVFKKAWHCVFKKIRLQKCDTNFKDDVKNTILKKVILKRPKLVKPISIIIEIASVLIVFITVWSIVIAIKSLLALWVFGTCNVSKPSACSLNSTEGCSIDASEAHGFFDQIGRSIDEWGEIFGAIPDRMKSWGENDFKDAKHLSILNPQDSMTNDNVAYDIIDPGCVVCMKSYRNQLKTDFFKNHKTYVLIYPIKNDDGYRFKNSKVATEFLVAVQVYVDQKENKVESDNFLAQKIITRLFTEKDEKGIDWQVQLNNNLSEQEVVDLFSKWLKEFGVKEEDINKIKELMNSEEVANTIENNKKIVDDVIHAKSIPTLIYDNKKHSGLYEK